MKNKKIIIIDGQGGRMGKMLIELLLSKQPELDLIAIGTNSIATSAMLKSGAAQGATGENPVVVNCSDADIIACPVGMIAANSLLGEVTPAMAHAVGASPAQKILVPSGKCKLTIAGIRDASLNDYIRDAAEKIFELLDTASV